MQVVAFIHDTRLQSVSWSSKENLEKEVSEKLAEQTDKTDGTRDLSKKEHRMVPDMANIIFYFF